MYFISQHEYSKLQIQVFDYERHTEWIIHIDRFLLISTNQFNEVFSYAFCKYAYFERMRLKWASKASNPFESNQERTDCDFIFSGFAFITNSWEEFFLLKMQIYYWALDVTDQLRLLKIPAGEAHFLVRSVYNSYFLSLKVLLSNHVLVESNSSPCLYE